MWCRAAANPTVSPLRRRRGATAISCAVWLSTARASRFARFATADGATPRNLALFAALLRRPAAPLSGCWNAPGIRAGGITKVRIAPGNSCPSARALMLGSSVVAKSWTPSPSMKYHRIFFLKKFAMELELLQQKCSFLWYACGRARPSHPCRLDVRVHACGLPGRFWPVAVNAPVCKCQGCRGNQSGPGPAQVGVCVVFWHTHVAVRWVGGFVASGVDAHAVCLICAESSTASPNCGSSCVGAPVLWPWSATQD